MKEELRSMVAQNREKPLSLSFASDFTPPHFDIEENDYHHSSLFFNQGRDLLQSGDWQGIKYFDLAAELDPLNAELLFQQGKTIFKYGCGADNQKTLLVAAKRFKKCTMLEPTHLEAWLFWGKTLYQLGCTYNETHYFTEAGKKFSRAISLIEDHNIEKVHELYWNNGLVMMEIATASQEVSDLNAALDVFASAMALKEHHPSTFWVDFGKVYYRLGQQINDSRLLTKAIECFKSGVEGDVKNFSAWHHMGMTFFVE